ncbi:hypothetical protein K1T71_004519 [Dendrolimus kikuchii]|uniref:Uncharacterized protein n=1 Tax=Dendrolimus kikuchii TaxID=765133 RepID=A0ACC1D7M8_9NEOP|nr:hypothetical protein K1T71_004519 [Dendrolimus kikuchii]
MSHIHTTLATLIIASVSRSITRSTFALCLATDHLLPSPGLYGHAQYMEQLVCCIQPGEVLLVEITKCDVQETARGYLLMETHFTFSLDTCWRRLFSRRTL